MPCYATLCHAVQVKAPEVQAKHEAALAAANTDLEDSKRMAEQEVC
jgi:hypothetical protein